MRRFISLLFLTVLVLAMLLAVPRSAYAQAGSAGDLLAAVNALRAQNGLNAYQTDGSLMASAQAHSDYMASVAEITHTRADGTSPADYSFIENIAGGMNLGPQAVVSSMWTDALHLSTLVGISEGFAGAGVAERDGVVYYTLQVRRAPGSVDVPLSVPAAVTNPDGSQPAAPQSAGFLQTAEPEPDGSIIHTVREGESVYSIAELYGVDVNDLIALNALPLQPTIFAGDTLLIRLAFTATVSPTVTKTVRPPTRTPAPTFTRRPPTGTPTITPTPTRTPFSLLNMLPGGVSNGRRYLGIGLIVVCAAGLIAVIVASLRK